MKKTGKLLAFIGIAGAAVAGFWYFLDRSKKDEYYACEKDEKDEAEDKEEETKREYVSLDTSEEKLAEAEAAAKRSLKETVKSVAMDMKQKAEDAAKGIGIVKDEDKDNASDFAFESFDDAKEPTFEADEKED